MLVPTSVFFPWLPVRWLHSLKYDTLKKLPRVNIPVLIAHSREDTLIRFHHAEKNFAAANDPKQLWITTGGHNDFLIIGDARGADGLEKFMALVESR